MAAGLGSSIWIGIIGLAVIGGSQIATVALATVVSFRAENRRLYGDRRPAGREHPSTDLRLDHR